MTKVRPFHLAIPVDNLEICRKFYNEVLKCDEGRSSEHWVDFDFFGHQLVLHERSHSEEIQKKVYNPVDGQEVPVPHFGVVMDWDVWHDFKDMIISQNIEFVIEPYIRFEGLPGEQATMFFLDPEENALEFKSFKNIDQLFSK